MLVNSMLKEIALIPKETDAGATHHQEGSCLFFEWAEGSGRTLKKKFHVFETIS